MFFVLSKVLSFIIQPMVWIVLLSILSLVFRRRIWKRRCLLASLVLLLFFGNRAIFNTVIGWWEVETMTSDQIEEPYDILILLGGYTNPFIVPKHDRTNLNFRGNRFLNAVELYKDGKVRKLLLTGGSPRLVGEDLEAEAIGGKQLLEKLGVPSRDIIVEPYSKNTYENAVFTKALLARDYPNASCLLVTSAFHIYRAQACFDHAGVVFRPYAVDFLQMRIGRNTPSFYVVPNGTTIDLWGMLIKEWVGIIVYKLVGYL